MFAPMKRRFLHLLCVGTLTVTASCGDNNVLTPAEDAQDAGREFIRASLDGDMRRASFYLLKDSVNNELFDKWKRDFYNKLTTEERVAYKNANILPINIHNENDSTVHYSFSNTYKSKDTTTVTIVRVGGIWQIDFKELH